MTDIVAMQAIYEAPRAGPSAGNTIRGIGSNKGTTIENDTAGLASDRVSGNAATNALAGKAGRNARDGGLGCDRLDGGAGADRFRFSSGRDRVKGLRDNADSLLLNYALWGDDARSSSQILAFGDQVGTTAVLDFGQGNVLTAGNVPSLRVLGEDLGRT